MHELPVYEIFIDGKPKKIELERTGESSFNVKMADKNLKVDLPADRLDIEEMFSIKIDDEAYRVQLPRISRGKRFPVEVEEATFQAELKIPAIRGISTISRQPLTRPRRGVDRASRHVSEGEVTSPMTGRILTVLVKKGDQVKAGQVLCLLEAMKMENEITASKTGIIQEVYVSEGSTVSEGEALFVIA